MGSVGNNDQWYRGELPIRLEGPDSGREMEGPDTKLGGSWDGLRERSAGFSGSCRTPGGARRASDKAKRAR